MKTENRFKVYRIDQTLALLMLQGIAECSVLAWPEQKPLPEDAEIESIVYDWDTRSFSIRVWSASFDIVPDGEAAPREPELLEAGHFVLRKIETHERLGQCSASTT